MILPRARIVFDCMVYAQGLISPNGPAAKCISRVRSKELHLFWSDYVLLEIRELPGKLPPRLNVTADLVEAFVRSLAPHAEYVSEVPEIYVNPFDRDDSHYINLAAFARADLITTRDNDLLRLTEGFGAESLEFQRLFPELRILRPEKVLDWLDQSWPEKP